MNDGWCGLWSNAFWPGLTSLVRPTAVGRLKLTQSGNCLLHPEGGQLEFYFDLIFASKKDRTVNKKVA